MLVSKIERESEELGLACSAVRESTYCGIAYYYWALMTEFGEWDQRLGDDLPFQDRIKNPRARARAGYKLRRRRYA